MFTPCKENDTFGLIIVVGEAAFIQNVTVLTPEADVYIQQQCCVF